MTSGQVCIFRLRPISTATAKKLPKLSCALSGYAAVQTLNFRYAEPPSFRRRGRRLLQSRALTRTCLFRLRVEEITVRPAEPCRNVIQKQRVPGFVLGCMAEQPYSYA